ncbi:MAG: SMC-Scp complex subunit ScpB [Acidimicrobiales bacterium]
MADEITDISELEVPEDYATYQAVEALLLIASEPLSIEELCRHIDVDEVLVREALAEIDAHYRTTRRGFYLAEIAGGYQLRTRPEIYSLVRSYVAENYGTKLSRAALETLAIVAYRQPISRTQVSEIRGVNADGVMRLLVTRGYIEATHRDTGPGQAALYSTTARFLERLGLYSIEELPPLAEFVPTIEDVEALEAALFGDDESL